MTLKKFSSGIDTSFTSELNNNTGVGMHLSLKNHARQLLDRAGVYSSDTTDLWGDVALTDDANMRNNSLNTTNTTAIRVGQQDGTGNSYEDKFVINLSDEASSDTTYDPDSYTDPSNAFDSDDATYAIKSATSVTTLDSTLGKTFSSKYVYGVRYKILSGSNQGDGRCTVYTKTYDGSSWTTADTYSYSSESSDINMEKFFILDDTVQGVAITVHSWNTNGGSANYDTKIYSLEYGDMASSSIVSCDIPSGTFSSTVSSAIVGTLVADWESGDNIQFKLHGSRDLGTNTGNIDNLYYNTKYITASETSNIRDIKFKSDGTKMFILDGSGDKVYQYSLSTGWDITTASYDSKNFSVTSQASVPLGMDFNTDGTKMYISDGASSVGHVYQYTLSTAWDISTASYASKSVSVDSQSHNPYSVKLSSNGTKMYVSDYGNITIYQYTLSTAWDVSTASYASKSFDMSPQTGTDSVLGITFNTSGTKIYINADTEDVYQYTLSTAWDISTASYDSKTYDSLSVTDSSSSAIAISSSNDKVFLMSSSSLNIYSLDTWDGSYNDDSGWLEADDNIQSFTAFTTTPEEIQIKLIPKSSSPTAGYPSLKGFGVRAE